MGATVPFHAGRDISPALLRKIAADQPFVATSFRSSSGPRPAHVGRGASDAQGAYSAKTAAHEERSESLDIQ